MRCIVAQSCRFWTWDKINHHCYRKTSDSGRRNSVDRISGPANCQLEGKLASDEIINNNMYGHLFNEENSLTDGNLVKTNSASDCWNLCM